MPLAWCYETGGRDRDNGHHRRSIMGDLHSILHRCFSIGRSLDACPDPTAYMVRGNTKERERERCE